MPFREMIFASEKGSRDFMIFCKPPMLEFYDILQSEFNYPRPSRMSRVPQSTPYSVIARCNPQECVLILPHGHHAS
jgi:hypothetical protein